MVIASELRPGMVIRFEGQVYKVLEVESKAGAAKMGGVVKATLSNLHSGRMLDQHMRPQERLEDLELERLRGHAGQCRVAADRRSKGGDDNASDPCPTG